MKEQVIVNDDVQQGYTYYRTEPIGKQFDPEFKPDLTPQQMLELGIFGGVYLNDCQDEFPKKWFVNAKLSSSSYDKNLNFFTIKASQSLQYWIDKGWIYHEDPRGWFQWYCRYYMGRRCEDDDRQIKRWKALTRHIAQLQKHCPKGAHDCRRRQRQALLHWAYDSRKL